MQVLLTFKLPFSLMVYSAVTSEHPRVKMKGISACWYHNPSYYVTLIFPTVVGGAEGASLLMNKLKSKMAAEAAPTSRSTVRTEQIFFILSIYQ